MPEKLVEIDETTPSGHKVFSEESPLQNDSLNLQSVQQEEAEKKPKKVASSNSTEDVHMHVFYCVG